MTIKILNLLLTVGTLLALTYCSEPEKSAEISKNAALEQVDVRPPDRIILKERYFNIAIIEVDSVEYLCNANGGIIPMIRKNQKTE